MIVTLDIETRSRVDLKTRGMYAYGEDPSTEVLCVSAKADDKAPIIWIPRKYHDIANFYHAPSLQLINLIKKADIIVAHNMNFERCIWHNIMHKRYGFEDLPFEKLRCSAAKSSAFALPRHLDGACKALSLSHQKDNTGYRIMLKWCKPRKPTKNNPKEWCDDPEEFRLLCEYCEKDVDAEYELWQRLPDLSETEWDIWRLDQRINDRGLLVDIESIDALIDKVKEKERRLLLEIQTLTAGKVNSPRQHKATLDWLAENGCGLKNLQKETVSNALLGSLPDRARRLLEIRQILAKASVTKLVAMKNRSSLDGRIRGAFIYHRATTGRFSGSGIQPQNLPRDSYDEDDILSIVSSDVNEIDDMYGCIFHAASRCIRGMIKAAPGRRFLCADFASIEAIVLAWLAYESKVLKAFSAGRDLYKVAAQDIYNVEYDNVTAEQRQIGKTAVLSLGYQGWLGAFLSMAKNYGLELDEEKAKVIILSWRDTHKNIVRFWGEMENAAIQAVASGNVQTFGRIKFGIRGDFLHCRLPSGRCLSYYKPKIKLVMKWGERKPALSFMSADSQTRNWCEHMTYGGKLTENIVQATARDLLVEAMLRQHKAGYKIVMHVHDEIVAEMPEGIGSLNEFKLLMSQNPEWADGLPIKAEGWEGYRYKK